MKILVVSDSHKELNNLIDIYNLEKPDIVISAGDYFRDCEELSHIYPDSRYFYVPGNCDFFSGKLKDELFVYIHPFKFFITHGHLYHVKRTYNAIKEKGKQLQADVIICGHTHKKLLEKFDNITIFNPGAAVNGDYGIININDLNIEFLHKALCNI
jgi:putative phosphoesterase